MIQINDDNLSKFASEGATPLPDPVSESYIESEGARIWYAEWKQMQYAVKSKIAGGIENDEDRCYICNQNQTL